MDMLRLEILSHQQELDIIENPYGAPRPTESQNTPEQQKKFQKP